MEKVGFSGNWIKKLAWLKEAVEYDTEIVGFQKEILILRQQTYEPKIQKINDALHSFKTSARGGSRGLDDAISQLQDEVDESLNRLSDITKKADAEDLQQDARYKIYEAEEKISDYKDKLARVKMGVGFIEDLQKAFENRVAVLDGYVEKAKEITTTSKNKVDEIFGVFDHGKARDLTFYVKGLCDNIKKMYLYIKEDALKLFDTEQDALSKEIEKLNGETSQIRDAFTKARAEVEAAEKLLDVAKLTSVSTDDKTVVKKEGDVSQVSAKQDVSGVMKQQGVGSGLMGLLRGLTAFIQKVFVFFVRQLNF